MNRIGPVFLCGFLFLAGCTFIPSAHRIESRLSGKLTLTGSSTMAPMISEMARRYEQDHPGVRIDVQTGGSSRGIRDVRKGVADFGMSSRKLKPEELTDMTADTIAWDGVTFAVNRKNPVNYLTREQLILIYTGKVSNWKAVGGNDAPILVSSRAEGRSELELISRFLGIRSSEIKADVIDGETQQSIKTVVTNVNAIVYTSVGAAQYAAERGEAIKLLPLQGVVASTNTVQTGEFPLARPLLLILHVDRSSKLAMAFKSYVMSAEVDDVTSSFGYVPLQRDEPGSIASSTTGDRE